MSALISLLLPTRGRRALAERFLRSAVERAALPDRVEAIIYADDDDRESHSLAPAGLKCSMIVGPKTSMGAYNTACYERSTGDIVVLCNDDVVIRTQGWDERLRELDERFADRVYLGYPNDLFKGRRLCSFPILSRRTCELLGEPFPTVYRGSFIDYHLLDIFKRLERHGWPRLVYLEDVVFEHMHHRTGKGNLDDTYLKRDRFGDDTSFLALRRRRSRDALRLLRAMDPSAAATESEAPYKDFARAILLDGELPLRWRGFLFAWFVGRTLAAKGLLPGVKHRGEPL